MVSNIFYFHPYLGKIPILTHIFQRGWFNHQPVRYFPHFFSIVPGIPTVPWYFFPLDLGWEAQLLNNIQPRRGANNGLVGLVEWIKRRFLKQETTIYCSRFLKYKACKYQILALAQWDCCLKISVRISQSVCMRCILSATEFVFCFSWCLSHWSEDFIPDEGRQIIPEETFRHGRHLPPNLATWGKLRNLTPSFKEFQGMVATPTQKPFFFCLESSI